VTIYRHHYGVPHIVEDTEAAPLFSYGYAHAQDHLEAMMLQYRDARGRRLQGVGFAAPGEAYFRLSSIRDALLKLADKPYAFPNLGSNHFATAPEKSAEARIIRVERTCRGPTGFRTVRLT
jgi:hypothetical protein